MANLDITWVAQDIEDTLATLSADIVSGSEIRRVDLPANTTVKISDLDPGDVFVRGRLPSGETLLQTMSLEQKDSEQQLELVSPSYKLSQSTNSKNSSSAETNQESETPSAVRLLDRCWLRLWVYEARRENPWISVELPDALLSLRDDGVNIRFTQDSSSTKPAFLELGGLGPLATFSAIPPVRNFSANIRFTGDAGCLDEKSRKAARLDIASTDPRHSSIAFALQAINGGGFESGRATFKAIMRKLLIEKFVDPYGAIAGCYFLILGGDADDLDDMPWRLYEDAAKESPDSALLFAWQQIILHSADNDTANQPARIEEFKKALLAAVHLGIPIFSVGLNFIFEQLRSLNDRIDPRNENSQQISEAVNQFGRRLDATEPNSVLTTFTGIAPWAPMAYPVYQHLVSRNRGREEDLGAPHDVPTKLLSLKRMQRRTITTVAGTKETKKLSERAMVKIRVGLAFQGGSFLGGAVATGTVKALVEEEIFDKYDVRIFTGTSAGAIVAVACWCHAARGIIENIKPQAAMTPVPALLEQLWLHNAKRLPDLLVEPWETAMLIPTQGYGDLIKFLDYTARHNWIYDKFMQIVWARSLRGKFKAWIRKYITRNNLEPCVARLLEMIRPISEATAPSEREALVFNEPAKKEFVNNTNLPGFALGSANVISGKIMSFSEYDVACAADDAYRQAITSGAAETEARKSAIDSGIDRLYEFIEASGSLEEVNDATTISDGPYAGTYLDGAWGQNPPLNEMIDYGVEEIWLVEIFPQQIEGLPASFSERRDRQEELWQNSLVEHELYMINKINEWKEKSYFFENAPFRHIRTRRIPMTLEFTPGARIVNWEPYLIDKITYGLSNGKAFVATL